MLHVLSGTSRPGEPGSETDFPAPPRPAPAVIDTHGRNPISTLNEYTRQRHQPVPGYTYPPPAQQRADGQRLRREFSSASGCLHLQ